MSFNLQNPQESPRGLGQGLGRRQSLGQPQAQSSRPPVDLARPPQSLGQPSAQPSAEAPDLGQKLKGKPVDVIEIVLEANEMAQDLLRDIYKDIFTRRK